MLYLTLGKPYLAATEGNEHAHQELKKYFRKLCSHSNKTTCDMLQFLNLHCIKHLMVIDHGDEMQRTKEMARRLGKKTHSETPIPHPALKKCKQDDCKQALRERVAENNRELPGYAPCEPCEID